MCTVKDLELEYETLVSPAIIPLDEYDIVDADEAYKEYVDSGNKSRPIEEFWKEQEIN